MCLTRLIRDAMVEKIWEGTENIMALDMMRAAKDGKAVTAFVKVLLVFRQVITTTDNTIYCSGQLLLPLLQAQRRPNSKPPSVS